MFNDTDAHWWLAVDEKTGRMWLASRFGGYLLDTDALTRTAMKGKSRRGRGARPAARKGDAAHQPVDRSSADS